MTQNHKKGQKEGEADFEKTSNWTFPSNTRRITWTKILFPPGLEPGTFRVLGERDNHYTTETDAWFVNRHIT